MAIGHARGSLFGDHCGLMMLIITISRSIFDQHPYVVSELLNENMSIAFCPVIVPEENFLYRIHLKMIETSLINWIKCIRMRKQNPTMKVKFRPLFGLIYLPGRHSVRSTLPRQIPDSEMTEFLAKHGDQLNYVATRGQKDLVKFIQ